MIVDSEKLQIIRNNTDRSYIYLIQLSQMGTYCKITVPQPGY